MRKARFTVQRIIGGLKEHEARRRTPGPCRKHGMSDQTSRNRKAGAVAVQGWIAEVGARTAFMEEASP
jgi:hypothetical protein